VTRHLLAVAVAAFGVIVSPAPARADVCMYPFVGVAANVLFGRGAFCDGPTEIGGQHMHCEAGGFDLGGGLVGSGQNGSFGLAGGGISGGSCSWRCPDNTLAPAPNPPGAWKSYLVPHPVACKDHMDPNGFWSEPVHEDEGLPSPPEPPQIAPGTPNP
jgi:hypothetical protein